MEYDAFLIKVKDGLSDLSASSFSSFITESENASLSMSNSISSFRSSATDSGIWKNDVVTSFNEMVTSCEQEIKSTNDFIANVVKPVSAQIEPLKDEIDSYKDAVDAYNKAKEAYDASSAPSESSYSSESDYQAAYNSWSSSKASLKTSRDNALKNAQDLSDSCYSMFNAINALLGETEEVASPTLSGGYEPTIVCGSRILEDGSVYGYKEYYDENGIKVEEEYTIENSAGEEVERGKNTFYSNGNLKSNNSTRTNENGMTFTNDLTEYDINGKLINRTVEKVEYPNGDAEYGVTLEYDKNGILKHKNVSKTVLSDPVMQESVERLEQMGCTNIQMLRDDEKTFAMHEFGINSKDKEGFQYWANRYKKDPDTGWEVYEKTEFVSVEDAEKAGVTAHDSNILTFEKEINNSSFNYIVAYDAEKDAAYHAKFNDRIEFLLKDLETVPPEMTNEIMSKNPTYVKFSETPEVTDFTAISIHPDGSQELVYGGGGGSGKSSSGQYNVVQASFDENWDDNYYSGMLLHELGHAYDAYSIADGSNWDNITGQEVNAFLQEFAPTHELVDWNSLDPTSQKSYVIENFANCFREYCRNPERLKASCPESYKAMNSLFHNSAAKYGKNNYKASADTSENVYVN